MMKPCENLACEERFLKIESQLHKGDVKFTELKAKLDNLIASQKMLTKALWGLASAIIVALFSFVLDKI